MGFSDEEALKKSLAIDTWRELSKDKILSFAAALPTIDKDLALKAVAQFPNFKSLVSEALESIEKTVADGHRFGWKSQKRVHKAFQDQRDALMAELERSDHSPEDRFRILEMLNNAVRDESAKDSEHKAQTRWLVGAVGTAVVVVASVGLAALGGKVTLPKNLMGK